MWEPAKSPAPLLKGGSRGDQGGFRDTPDLPNTGVTATSATTFDRTPLYISHPLNWRKRKALVTTETELKAMAAPAMAGLSNQPKTG